VDFQLSLDATFFLNHGTTHRLVAAGESLAAAKR
jgi:hypothetical protein